MIPTVIRAPSADPSPRLGAALERLNGLHPKVIDLSLGRIEGLLAKLGSPHQHLPTLIHVAGTNGKGSTVAFLRAMLEAAGKRVHVYTSPHLVRFNERIRLAGALIEDEALADLLERVEACNDGEPITYFEITTAAAFLAFAETAADVVLLETGLGGTYDATNVVTRKAATAITRISYDHMNFLGADIAGIAGEKAGIMQAGVPAIIARQALAEVDQVFRHRADALPCPLLAYGDGWTIDIDVAGFRFADRAGALDLPAPALPGQHQFHNAGTAVATLRQVVPAIDGAAIAAGIAGVEWPARLQRLRRGPLTDRLGPAWELWLDGGHNDSAGEVLADQMRRWREDGRPLDLVVGMLGSKQPADFFRPLAPFVRRLLTIPMPAGEAGHSAADLRQLAQECGFVEIGEAESVETAVATLAMADGRPGRLLICGSLYLAGWVLRANG